jgi:ferrochelatase
VNGAVVMAYGTPASLDDLEAYYTHIRRGRPPSAEQVAELRSRYEAIGGTSPLRAVTEAQADRIAARLGDGWLVEVGMKHASPFVEDAVDTLTSKGVERIVGVVLAPHDSRGSVGEYVTRVEAASSVPTAFVRSWWDLPEHVAFLAGAIGDVPPRTKVLFTAHSLPERVLAGDLYVEELAAAASRVAESAGLRDWDTAWQSAGRTPEPWRGPDVLEVLDDVAATGSADGVVVCPHGFVADHLEVLYDLDVVAAERAASLGLAFRRTRSLNDDAAVLAALAERVRAAA